RCRRACPSSSSSPLESSPPSSRRSSPRPSSSSLPEPSSSSLPEFEFAPRVRVRLPEFELAPRVLARQRIAPLRDRRPRTEQQFGAPGAQPFDVRRRPLLATAATAATTATTTAADELLPVGPVPLPDLATGGVDEGDAGT